MDKTHIYQCDPGFTGETLNGDIQIHETITEADSPCDPGYTGAQCTINIDNCIGVNCSGRGQCMDGNNLHSCLCNAVFTGVNCDVNIKDCMNNSCSGHGPCINGVNSFSCKCDSGYTGELYNSVMVSDCSSFHCTNGSCSLSENSEPVCNCDPGYTRERYRIDIDGVDCGNNYHCVDRMNSYYCICIERFCELPTEGKHYG